MTAPPVDVAVPGDKSLSHRALMFAAIARGRSRITGLLDSADVRSTAACLRQLGAAVGPPGADVTIEGRGVAALHDAAGDLDCGNSGTTARLLAGLVAGAGRAARFVGDASLSRRPMRRIAEPLRQMGARIDCEHGDGLPMRIVGGALAPLDYESPVASAQVKSAVLLAGLTARVPVSVREPERSRDHTERMLAALGARVEVVGTRVALAAMDRDLDSFSFAVPGDPSSAAYFAAWAALAGVPLRTSHVSVNPTRIGFLRVLERAGVRVGIEARVEQCGEPTGQLAVDGRAHGPLRVDPAETATLIDELPLIACVASRLEGETRVTGAAELRVKESDRIAAVVQNLRAVGADADELPDGFVVRGSSRPLRGRVTTHGDHRIAMAFGVLGALDGAHIEVDDPACVAVSFPAFWDAMGALAAPR